MRAASTSRKSAKRSGGAAASTGAASLELVTERDNVSAQALYEDLGYARDDAYWHYALSL